MEKAEKEEYDIKEKNNKAEDDAAVKYYEERRKSLDDIRSSSMDSFDKVILQVSTGALVITITFIDKIGKPYDLGTNYLLTAFWILFLAVILLNIFSYYSAKKNMDFKIEDLDRRYKEHGAKWQQNSGENFSRWRYFTEKSNILALICFVAGATLFFYYAYLVQMKYYEESSKKGEMTMANDKKIAKPEPVQKPVKTPVDAGMTESREKPIKPPKK